MQEQPVFIIVIHRAGGMELILAPANARDIITQGGSLIVLTVEMKL